MEEFVLPAGLRARDGEGGVEIVDATGELVAVVHDGWATDAGAPLPGLAPVSVRLLPAEGAGSAERATEAGARSTTTTVAVEVSIDQGWLDDPVRRFPVTVDPSVTFASSTSNAKDTMVFSAYPNDIFGYYPEVWAAVDGASRCAAICSSPSESTQAKWATWSRNADHDGRPAARFNSWSGVVGP